MWLSFLGGNLDFAEIPKEQFGRAVTGTSKYLSRDLARKGIRLWQYPSLQVSYIGFNMEDPVLRRPNTLKSQAEIVQRGLVGPGLLGGDNPVKLDLKPWRRKREEIVVDIGNDGQFVFPLQRL